MSQANVLGALARGTEEDLWRRRVRVLLQEVVLDLPRVVVAELVRQLDLSQRVLQQLVLRVLAPRPGQLMLVEDAEPHRNSVFVKDVDSPISRRTLGSGTTRALILSQTLRRGEADARAIGQIVERELGSTARA